MAVQYKIRRNTKSYWTTNNPVVPVGEPILETDTLQFKVGDGVTAYNSLVYQGITPGSPTTKYTSFGDGSSGVLNPSSGTTTLSTDPYYSLVQLTGTANMNLNGFRLFTQFLDLSNSPAGAINCNGLAGGNASGATGGSAATAPANGSVGNGTVGAAGVTGTTGVGATGNAGNTTSPGNGGSSGAGGAGGAGTSGAGGGAKAAAGATQYDFRRFDYELLKAVTLILGGAGAPSGASGAGDGTNSGGGGGAGGNGAGICAIFAKTIYRNSNTPAGVIQAVGGAGGIGGAATAGVCGGGGGGAGGGGGWVIIFYENLIGRHVANAIWANGGMGGYGGVGFGSGGIGGNGGNGGNGGRITLFQTSTGICTDFIGPAPYYAGSPGGGFGATGNQAGPPGGAGMLQLAL